MRYGFDCGRFLALLLALPPGAAAQAVPDTLSIAVYNIHHGEGTDGVVDLERIAGVLAPLDADLVALQEVDVGVERTGGVDQPTELGGRLGMTPVFGMFMPYQGGEYGMAVLSRWPVEESWNRRLPDGAEPRTSVTVRVRSPRGRQVMFSGVHFYRTAGERMAQARALVEALEGWEGPAVLAGDFNSTPESEVSTFLRDHWTVIDKGEDHLTFPSYQPAREIDYVMVRPATAFRVLEERVLDEPVASDHRPLRVLVEVR